jgi:hypothetical protein
MVLLIGDRRLLPLCALTFLGFYFGLIPAEEEFLDQKFQQEYAEYCGQVPRLLPRLKAWAPAGVAKRRFDRSAAYGELRLSPILAAILGLFRVIAALKRPKGS